MSNNQDKTIVIGPEYDEGLFLVLKSVLMELEANELSRDWGVGGSQEIMRYEFIVGKDCLVVEAETYIGLSITGPPDLVNYINRKVRGKLSESA